MFTMTHLHLKLLAALLWLAGGVILLLKSASLLMAAYQLNASLIWSGVAIICGLVIGVVKVKFLFRPICRKNLLRIEQLQKPRLWAFYRPRFFLFLTVMISVGAMLSYMAQGSPPMLIAVAILDLSIATALLGSGSVFIGHER